MPDQQPGVLFVVATPIGNLGDFSARAVETLNGADFIAAEDTRVTLKLLSRFGVKKQLISYYEHNRKESGGKILQRILSGESCALVTDAGTPGISDPGEDLIGICADAGIEIISIPGPCAAVAAVAISGLPAGRFVFEGFLSTARKSRFEHLNDLVSEKRTMVFYEAPHKLMRTLVDMLAVFGDRRISISRELTKLHEETLRTTLSEAIAHFEQKPPRGEFVLVIEGASVTQPTEMDMEKAVADAKTLICDGLSTKDSVKRISKETGLAKNALYRLVMDSHCII